MGIFDSVKNVGRNIWNVAKKPLSYLWSGVKKIDDVLSNPIIETGIAISNPELSPILAGYDIAKYGLENLGVNKYLDDALA